MPQPRKASKNISNNWLNKIDPEEIKQEELIQAWKNPESVGYEGILSLYALYIRYKKEKKIQDKTIRLKKNTPDKKSGVLSFDFILWDYLLSVPKENRGLFCIVIQPFLQSIYYGKSINSIEKQSSHLGVSKSSLGRLLKKFKEDYYSNSE
jgi:hypothetical protein